MLHTWNSNNNNKKEVWMEKRSAANSFIETLVL